MSGSGVARRELSRQLSEQVPLGCSDKVGKDWEFALANLKKAR